MKSSASGGFAQDPRQGFAPGPTIGDFCPQIPKFCSPGKKILATSLKLSNIMLLAPTALVRLQESRLRRSLFALYSADFVAATAATVSRSNTMTS